MLASINTKLTAILGAGSLFALACVYLAIAYFYGENIDILVRKDLRQADHLVKEQIRLDTNKLGAALEVFISDRSLADTFNTGDRSRLLAQVKPVFEGLKSKYGITHLYFHLPDGTVFLRAHKPAQFGDKINRATFEQVLKTGTTSSGLELGKTGFALRIVSPLYRSGTLIGYVELGEEIDHFIEFLKGVTGNEYSLVVDKRHVDHQQLATIFGMQGRPDSWERMRDFVDISAPVPSIDSLGCFNNATVQTFMSRADFDHSRSTQSERICAGFPVRDANGNTVGAMVTLIDVSHQTKVLSAMKRYSIIFALLMFVSIFAAVIFLARRYILSPIGEISRAAHIFATGDLKEHRISVSSRDEIGMLAESINEMAMQLDQHYSNTIERSVELEQLNRSLEALATTDGLTGLYNHRYFFKKLAEEIIRARRYEHSLALIMADIDYFKNYNDAHGHLSGDTLLRKIAVIFQECSRDIDVVARYGGEEFAIILFETSQEEALACAERIRARIAATDFPYALSQPGGQLTVSFGVASLSDEMKDVSDFVSATDQKLYRAKNLGRNRIEA